MLEAMRKGVGSWVSKLLLLVLVVSFGLWGINDVFRGRGAGAVARVGSVDITAEEYSQQYRRQFDLLQRQFRGRLTPEQARLFRLDEQALTSLISAAAVDQEAKSLDLAVSPAYIIEQVRKQPGFAGLDGKFDREAFEGALLRAGLSEQQFMRLRQQEEARAHLQEAVSAAVSVPQVLIDILFRHRDEMRTVSYATIDAAKTVVVPQPTEEQIKQTFESNRRQFVVPETRKIAALVLDTDEIKSAVAVSEAEIAAAYQRDKARYETAERRKLQQIAFKDEAAARAAKAEIAKGKPFVEVAKAAGASESDIDLGTVAKAQMIDQTVAEAAFSVAKGAVSDVIKGAFSTVLIKVVDVEPGSVKPLAEVAAEIKDRLAREQAVARLQVQHDDVERLRLEAKPLREIAADVKGRLVEIAATDRLGNGFDGKPASSDKLAARLAAAAFEGKVGGDSQAIEVPNGYAWVDVLSSTPEKPKTLEEVKEDVKAVWTETERRRQLASVGAKLVERLGKGEALEVIAKEVGAKVEVAKSIKRMARVPGLTEAAVAQAFVLAKGQAASAESADGQTRVILRVDDVTLPPFVNAAEIGPVRQELSQQMEGDIQIAFIEALKDKLGVRIDERARKLAVGSEDSE